MKKDEILRGGLNSLFQTPSQPETVTPPSEASELPKQDIIEELDDEQLKEALRKRRMQHRGRPKKGADFISQTDGYQRISLIAQTEKMDKIREIALRESLTIKEVVEAAFDLAIERYEAKRGEIKPTKVGAKVKKDNLFK